MADPAEVTPVEQEESSELAKDPVTGLVARYSWLTLRGMAAQIVMVALEGFIMGVGLGAHGLACVGIIMSVEYINLAFGNLYGTGVPTLVGNLLGSGKVEEAKKAFSQSFWLTLYTGVLIAVLFEVFTPQLATAFGATPDILEDSVAGIRTFGVLLPFTILGQMLTAVMRVDEKPRQSGNIVMFAALVAAGWLALSTFVLHLGVAGAGIYYGLSIGLFSLGFFYFIGGRSQLAIRLEDAKLDAKLCGQVLKMGLPFFLVQFGTFVFNTVANNLLGAFGGEEASLYIAAFSVINGYIVYIIMMVAQSFAYGMQPIAAFNAGARAYQRLKEAITSSLKLEIISVAALTAVLWLAAEPICAFFTGGDPVLTPITVSGARIVILACCLGFTSMMMSIYFQSSDNIVLSTVLGLSRYVIFSCPLMYLMGNLLGIQGIWWALVVADVCTGILCLGCAAWELKRLSKEETHQGADASGNVSMAS